MDVHFNELFESQSHGYIAKTDIRLGAMKIQKGTVLSREFPNFDFSQLADKQLEVLIEKDFTAIIRVLPHAH